MYSIACARVRALLSTDFAYFNSFSLEHWLFIYLFIYLFYIFLFDFFFVIPYYCQFGYEHM